MILIPLIFLATTALILTAINLWFYRESLLERGRREAQLQELREIISRMETVKSYYDRSDSSENE